mmetsp:Transcript_126432/g.224018  ORF Transcript_126432/g.224018 Transcript_126432/m.224018 type:complete len:636 (-) Transcript_126432:73-1980(-)
MPWVPVGRGSARGIGRGFGRHDAPKAAAHDTPSSSTSQGASALGARPFEDGGSPSSARRRAARPPASEITISAEGGRDGCRPSLASGRKAWADMVSDGSSESEAETGFVADPVASLPVAEGERGVVTTPVASTASASPSPTPAPATPTGNAPWAAVDCAEWWTSEVRNIAAHLRFLATLAPSLESQQRNGDVMTSITATDMASWQAQFQRLQATRAEASTLDVEAADAEEAAEAAEHQHMRARAEASSAAQWAVGSISAEVAKRTEEHRAAAAGIAAAMQTATAAQAAAESSAIAAQRRATCRKEELQRLHDALAAQELAARRAEEEAASARSSRARVKELPATQRRLHAGESRAKKAKQECTQLRQQVGALRAELDAAPRAGAGCKAEALEARAAQLEQDCRELQGGHSPLEGSTDAAGVKAVRRNRCGDGKAEVAHLEDRNRFLLAEVRDARSARDQANTTLTTLSSSVQSLQSRCEYSTVELNDIQLQLEDLMQKNEVGKREAESRRQHIADLEQQARSVETLAVQTRERHTEVSEVMRNLTVARQRAEKKVAVLEFQLQKALVQMEKERPGAKIGMALMREPRSALGRGARHRCGGAFGGSDAGSESVDADVSTTAGESVADGLLDAGGLA